MVQVAVLASLSDRNRVSQAVTGFAATTSTIQKPGTEAPSGSHRRGLTARPMLEEAERD